MYTLEEKIRNFSILSRVFVIALQIVANVVIPDHEADAFVSPPDPLLKSSGGDDVVEFMFDGLRRWDAQYFIHVAEYGYTHENTLVFFPLYPLLVRWLGTVFNVVFSDTVNYHNCLIVAAVCINTLCFVKTSVIIFKLSQRILGNEQLAYKAALLFCLNPANIFFVAPYSESLYAFLTFRALLYIEQHNTNLSTISFMLAALTRSNGIVNLGFLFYYKLKDSIAYFHRIHIAKTKSGSLHMVLVVILSLNYLFIPLFVQCALVCLPFILFQIYCYQIYCRDDGGGYYIPSHLELYLRSNFYHSPDLGEAEWCLNSPPIAYSHVQDKYWNVGLLRYYEMKQLPNFLLALPVVLTVISHAALYMVDNPQVFWHMGITPTDDKKKKSEAWLKTGINSPKLFVYVIHSLALCIFCVICIHVQVTTRLICSSSPVIYWFAGYLMTDTSVSDDGQIKKDDKYTDDQHSTQQISVESKLNMSSRFKVSILSSVPKNFWGQAIISFFIIYFFVGIFLFSNFLPWT